MVQLTLYHHLVFSSLTSFPEIITIFFICNLINQHPLRMFNSLYYHF